MAVLDLWGWKKDKVIQASREDVIDGSSAQRMSSTAVLRRAGPQAGRLSVSTRAWTGIDLKGFTGGVRVRLLDTHGAVLATSGLRTIGVDGDSFIIGIFSNGSSDRRIDWEEYFPPDLAAATTALEIEQKHESQFDLGETLAAVGDAVVKVGDAIGDAFDDDDK